VRAINPDAVAVGGPLDGQVLGSAGPDRYNVTMVDGTHHRYQRQRTADADAAPVPYDYFGRAGA
jgi:hypothetical protein